MRAHQLQQLALVRDGVLRHVHERRLLKGIIFVQTFNLSVCIKYTYTGEVQKKMKIL